MKKKDEKERIIELAGKITTLWPFIAMLIPDKDLILKAANAASERNSFAASAAPVLLAFGIDYEEKELDANLHYKRAKALYDLVDTLEQTENERIEFYKKKESREKGRAELAKILGGL